MSSSLEINDKELLSIRLVTERSSYSRDYITRLAREGKIVASFVDRQWFVDPISLDHYEKSTELELQTRKDRLSEERKRERQERELALHRARLREHVEKSSSRNRSSHNSLKAPVMALGVLLIGLGVGIGINSVSLDSGMAGGQTAAGVSVVENGKLETVTVLAEDVASPLNFSQESVGIATLEGADHGVLLLPNNEAGIQDPSLMFSDDVKVLTDEHGNRFVARVDKQGRIVEEIPFVVVPVTSDEKP